MAVSAAVRKFSGHASPAVRSACEAVSKRREELLAKQRDQLALQEGRNSFQPTEGAERGE
eukprot:COSAG04_NODE_2745_length_3649_cov_5.692676_3_plen_60_part_00